MQYMQYISFNSSKNQTSTCVEVNWRCLLKNSELHLDTIMEKWPTQQHDNHSATQHKQVAQDNYLYEAQNRTVQTNYLSHMGDWILH